jgi:hypothetical protein
MNDNTFTKTTLIECPRSQSDEGIANNNVDPSKWTNRVGQGLVLKPGDQISVHSSYVSEIGAESGQIQIKGQELNASVNVEITDFENLWRNEEVPQKYVLQNASNKQVNIKIRDDTLNLVVSPYKCANIDNYVFLPRRYNTSGTTQFWKQNEIRDGTALPATGNRNMGQTQFPPPALNRCSADLSIKYWGGDNVGKAMPDSKVSGKNDGSRFTLFTRQQTFYNNPADTTLEVSGISTLGSPILQVTHSSSTTGLIPGHQLTIATPLLGFNVGASVVSVSGSLVTMSENAIATTTTHNRFKFSFSNVQTRRYFLPPDTTSGNSAAVCESLRDPAILGDYIQIKNLVSVKANPGYNSPTDLAVQLTEELIQRTDLEPFTYSTSNVSNTLHIPETFTFKSETQANKLYNVATANGYERSNYEEWLKIDGTGDISKTFQYLSSYQIIGIKRPELYVAGKKLNNQDGYNTSLLTPNASGDPVFVTNIDWSDENLLKFKQFFDVQTIYPELFQDYRQNDIPIRENNTRFFHINNYDNANGTFLGKNMYFGARVRNDALPVLGYDLYNATYTDQQTSYPLFVDFNPDTVDSLAKDVQQTEYGSGYFSTTLTSDYQQLAYGFGRKVEFSKGVFKIGFQFSQTGNKIPDYLFNTNASAGVGEPTEQLGSGFGRVFGFDYHFTAYGTHVILPTNGNSDTLGKSFLKEYNKIYRFGQAATDTMYLLDKYQFGMYMGADDPLINFDTEQQRFQIRDLHTSEVVGNLGYAGYNNNGTVLPVNPNAGDKCYKINKRPLYTNYSPEIVAYVEGFSGAVSGASTNTYNSHNPNVEPWKIMDAMSGLFIEDWVVPEDFWDESLVGIMGYRYEQFHNPNTTSSRQVRLKAAGANADLNNVNVITTNANVDEGDLIEYQMNSMAESVYQPMNTVGVTPAFATRGARYILPPITISPATSVNITAKRLPSKTLRPYYTIRSNIIEENQVLGGTTSGVTLPIVAITNKANPYGDFLNGFQGQITFTNTIDRVLTRIRCSIHEPDGTAARCDLNSAVIFRIDQKVQANMNVVGDLLASKKKSDKILAEELEDPELEFSDVKYTKEIFQ